MIYFANKYSELIHIAYTFLRVIDPRVQVFQYFQTRIGYAKGIYYFYSLKYVSTIAFLNVLMVVGLKLLQPNNNEQHILVLILKSRISNIIIVIVYISFGTSF